MSTRHERKKKLRPRYRRESTHPVVVILCTLIMLVCLATAVGCAWMLTSSVVEQIGPFETVGRARPMPAWLAWIGLALGAAVAGQIAFENAAYLVRVIRKKPKRMLVPRDW
ncbi:hypothetical protein ACFVTX_05765 [Agromyces sp. NPDC058136]|uniref:hypothetical protein n=1 Tax=Agromyces sp. NPDC058136 TaxID=3346354 RepID=UPI0036DA674F